MVNDDKSKKKSRKPSKKLIYILIIIFVILAECFVIYYDSSSNGDNFLDQISDSIPFLSNSSVDVPFIDNGTIDVPFLSNSSIDVPFLENSDSNSMNVKNLKQIGNNSIGTVSVEGPYGNENSSVKIAYILGQHPRKSNAHVALYDALLNSSDSLNYSYYVYKINVTNESEDFEESRMNGQLLAEEFVVGDVINKGYDLAIDIHSSNGGYIQDPYIFAPVSTDDVAYSSANNLTNALKYIVYYEPASYSSPQYSTIPIENGGVPAIVFEMRGNPDKSLETEANEFVHAVDKLILNN